MELEYIADELESNQGYPLPLRETVSPDESILDWRPMIETIVADFEHGTHPGVISARFHNALAGGLLAVATKCGHERVVLSGGCFQNRYLTERCVSQLRDNGFRPYWHQRVPPNDGGIALGQVVAALRQKR